VRDIVDQLPQQVELNAAAREPAKKLAIDPYLRVVGAEDLIALGDCSKLLEDSLPATAQVRFSR
jgi:NADH:ubiquinone reductase (non-electrogenic)